MTSHELKRQLLLEIEAQKQEIMAESEVAEFVSDAQQHVGKSFEEQERLMSGRVGVRIRP